MVGEHLPADLLQVLEREAGVPLRYREPPARMLGGNETLIYSFELDEPPERFAGPLVLRMIPEHYDPRRALWEAAAQEEAAGQGLPAPRPRFASADPDELGHAFLVMDRVEGSVIGLSGDASPLQSASVLSRAAFLTRSVVRALGAADRIADTMGELQARLHALDAAPLRLRAEACGLPPAMYAAAGKLDEIATYIDRSGLDGLRPALDWFRAHPAPAGGREVICHGDFLSVNIFVQDGEVSALLDWSYTKLGPAAYDVGSTASVIAAIPGRLPAVARAPIGMLVRRLLRRYRRRYAEGGDVDDEAVHYWGAVRALYELSGVAVYRASGPSDAKKAIGGRNPWDHPGLIAALTKPVREVTGITPQLPS